MTTLTNFQIALIAGAASILTTGIHGFAQAVYLYNFSGVNILGSILGRIIGDFPTALLCAGIVYGLLRIRKKE